jgi:hypothetical protein
MFIDPNSLQVSGLTISFLLLVILIIREFALASSNPRWNRVSFYLMVPVLPLFVLFLIQSGAVFDPWEMPKEFQEVENPDYDLSTFSAGSPTPTLSWPVIVTPTPVPSFATAPAPKIGSQPVEPGIPESDPVNPAPEHQNYCPIIYREFP